jgi:hypothetical protein
MAQGFLGTHGLQETIDVAVRELLQRLHGVRGFTDALVNAEAHQRARAGVPMLTPQAESHARDVDGHEGPADDDESGSTP